jgi:hypothetical protein
MQQAYSLCLLEQSVQGIVPVFFACRSWGRSGGWLGLM